MKKQLLLLTGICCSLLRPDSIAQNFSSSNLPIVVINTNGQNIEIPYQKFYVSMGIIDHGPGNRNYLSDPFNSYNGEVEIDLHGSSTLGLPKKSYGITTVNGFHQHVKTSIMNMPPEDDWVMKAHYQDKTLMRDELTFYISREMGHYSSRSQFFELVINNDYKGVYEMQEKVKRDDFRVDIAKLKPIDISGDELTGGYIFALDKFQQGDEGWYSQYMSNVTHDSANYFLYIYPKPDSMPQVQKDYIKNYIDHFEDILASNYYTDPDSGYRKYIDEISFIDNFIVNEISKNVDGYRSSSFFYKDKDSKGGKLVCGPVWDFNIAWYNCSYNGGNSPSGWQYQQPCNDNFVPFWWWQFMSDPAFMAKLKCRYLYLRSTTLKQSNLDQHIDNMVATLNEGQARNFTRWPIMGQVVYPNPSPVAANYNGEISNLKTWLQNRMAWLDANMPGVCTEIGIAETNDAEEMIHSYPNPFTDNLTVIYSVPQSARVKLELVNIMGEQVIQVIDDNRMTGTYQHDLSVSDMKAGMYMIRLTVNDKVYHKKMIKLR